MPGGITGIGKSGTTTARKRGYAKGRRSSPGARELQINVPGGQEEGRRQPRTRAHRCGKNPWDGERRGWPNCRKGAESNKQRREPESHPHAGSNGSPRKMWRRDDGCQRKWRNLPWRKYGEPLEGRHEWEARRASKREEIAVTGATKNELTEQRKPRQKQRKWRPTGESPPATATQRKWQDIRLRRRGNLEDRAKHGGRRK